MTSISAAFLPPPIYFELYSSEAKADVNHPDHFVFTPPPPVRVPFTKLGVEVVGFPDIRIRVDLFGANRP